MKTIYVPVGLPGSGKTSWIRKKRSDLTAPSVVISGDQIRLMLNLGEYRFSRDDTLLITGSMVDMAINFLLRGYDAVFLDEYYLSNTAEVREAVVKALTLHVQAKIEFVNMKRDLGACIHRRCTDDREDDTARWPNVLLQLSETFEPYSHTEDKS